MSDDVPRMSMRGGMSEIAADGSVASAVILRNGRKLFDGVDFVDGAG